jgi:hypothetical protein
MMRRLPSRPQFHFSGRSSNGFYDILITGAAAEVGRENIDQLFLPDV